ncbi:hypothetical protein AVEN_54721-1 [Araneus ventricosus]|uniref:Uncharacterized protein n=1 Tax=Araneus ventricosus TaxID=182803 RepID=A0A4Y2FBJ2_ARAVE|nr:hypothetical protein AVEN_54721-1 [Araneus ventricosus]
MGLEQSKSLASKFPHAGALWKIRDWVSAQVSPSSSDQGSKLLATDDADVHIVKTAIETYEKIKKQVVAIGQDVDHLLLPTALPPDYMDILMLKEGKGKVKDSFYSSKDLQNCNLVIECTKTPFSSFMRLVFVTQLQGSMERENHKQCSCSTTLNTCKISLRSLITLNQLILILKEQERDLRFLFISPKKSTLFQKTSANLWLHVIRLFIKFVAHSS